MRVIALCFLLGLAATGAQAADFHAHQKSTLQTKVKNKLGQSQTHDEHWGDVGDAVDWVGNKVKDGYDHVADAAGDVAHGVVNDVDDLGDLLDGTAGVVKNILSEVIFEKKNVIDAIVDSTSESLVIVDGKEEGSGLPANTILKLFSSTAVYDIASLLNKKVTSGNQAKFTNTALSKPMGAGLNFSDVNGIFEQFMQHTTLARFLETSDGGETFQVYCNSQSSDPVMQNLFTNNLFTPLLPKVGDGVAATLQINEDGDLKIVNSTGLITVLLACMVEVNEVYHAGLHFINGNMMYAANMNPVIKDDPFLTAMLTIEIQKTEVLYAGVRWLASQPGVVFREAVPTSVIALAVKSALEDISFYNPHRHIPADKLSYFAGPLHDIYSEILATDFGYAATDTVEMYVADNVTATVPKNNLVRMVLSIGMLHTNTFTWQMAWGPKDPFEKVNTHFVSSSLLYSVAFPDVEHCLDSNQDCSNVYKAIVDASADGAPKEGLSGYLSWLNTYRAGLPTTGFQSGWHTSQCMSSSTWI